MQDRCEPRPCFTFFVDGQQFQVTRPKLTGAEIMEIADVTPEQGLLLCLEDGTQKSVDSEETMRLVPCPRFERAPRFKRG